MIKYLSSSFVIILMCIRSVWADAPKVITDIMPVHSLTTMVMEGVGTPDFLVDANASPHDFALRPSQVGQLENADIIFWIGEELTPWLAETIPSVAPKAQSVALLDTEGTLVFDYEEEHHDDDNDDHGDEDSHDHDGHDPHAWLDPENAKHWLMVIANELSQKDADNANLYQANAKKWTDRIDQKSGETIKRYKDIKDSPFIVFHAAYQYYERRFGLNNVGSLADGEATDPSAADMAAILDMIEKDDVKCMFSEPQHSDALITAITEQSGIRHGVLDPIGFDIAPGSDHYVMLLDKLSTALHGCLVSE